MQRDMAAAELAVLSAGAVAPALKKIVEPFERETRCRIDLVFATAPAIVERICADSPLDVVIAPAAVLDDLAIHEKISSEKRVLLGRIGVGVMVRAGAAHPPTATVEQLRQSLVDAASIVYNRASTGIYLDKLFQRLGIAAEVERKAARYADFAGVVEHISRGGNGELGFGATTVIVENTDKGVAFVGPLPAEIQNYTAYEAGVVRNRAVKTAAGLFLGHLESPSARSALTQAGVL